MRLIIHTFYCATAVLLSLTSVSAHAGMLDCTGCHAGPGDLRPIDAPTRDISSGGFRGNHRTHMSVTATATTCAVCHNNSNFQTDHRNYQIQVTSKISNYSSIFGKATYRTTRPAGSNGSTIFFNQTSVPTLASCTNVTCHFETITPVWGTDAVTAGFGCSSCHGNPPAGTAGNNYSGGAAGSHGTHSTLYTFTCSKCHSNHTLDATPFAHATSIGKRDLVVTPVSPDLINPQYVGTYTNSDRNYLPGQTDSHTFGSCAGTYCHSNGTRANPPYTAANGSTPSWGNSASGACGSCHNAIKINGFDPISSGAHKAHLRPKNYGPKMDTTVISSCQSCHVYSNNAATHVNGVVNIINPCTPCHPGSVPAWTKVNIDCQDCHGKNSTSKMGAIMNNMSAPDKWRFASPSLQVGRSGVGGHSAIVTPFTMNCTSATWCHRDHSFTSEPDPGHISGTRGDYRGLNFDMNPRTGIAATGNAGCLCHLPGYLLTPVLTHVASHNETNPSMVCNKCHDPHGSGNLQMVRAGIWYNQALAPTAISFSNRSTFVKYTGTEHDGLCQTCHTQTAHFKRGIAEPAGAGQHGNISNRNCTSCHKHGVGDNAVFAFQAPRCDSCHGYPPVSSMTGYGTQGKFSTAAISLNHQNSGGAHTAFGHLAPTIKATDANPWQACQPCHSGGAATHRVAALVKGFAAYSANVLISETYYSKGKTPGDYKTTLICSNVSCHGGAATPAPPWAPPAPGWISPITGDIDPNSCIKCHTINDTDNSPNFPEYNSPYSGLDPFDSPNLHYVHITYLIYTCSDCHNPSNASLGKGSAHFASLSTSTMGRASQTLYTSLRYVPDTTPSPISKGTCSNTIFACHGGETRTW